MATTRRQPRSKRSSSRTPARGSADVRSALRLGTENAQWLLDSRERRRRSIRSAAPGRRARREAVAGPRPLLVAEGDSWFNYPFFNTLEALEDGYDYDVESVAHPGDTMESMAYDPAQLDGFARLLAKLSRDQRTPHAVLLSAGGNDVQGPVLWTLLNHHGGTQAGFNESIMRGVFEERLRLALVTMLGTVTSLYRAHFSAAPNILIHGYDYPVADGRGYAGGFWVLPGPWLEPEFRGRGYQVLAERVRYMTVLIDRFNQMIASVTREPGLGHVRYVDLRGTLSADLPSGYKQSWANELHPTGDGFKAVADKLHRVLRQI